MTGTPCVLLTAVAVATLLMSVGTLVARCLQVPNVFVLVIAVVTPYMLSAALVGLILSLLCRRNILSVVAVCVLVATTAIQASWYYFGRPVAVGPHAEIRLLSSNLCLGQTDAPFFVHLAEASADVITVSELTPELFARLRRAGIEQAFPHSLLHPAPGAGGLGVWSRYPLAPLRTSTRSFHPVAARVQVPGIRVDPVVASFHVTSPIRQKGSFQDWRQAIAAADTQLTDLAAIAGAGAVIVGGDFNSTPDIRQFRDLLTDGYRDAVTQTGAGWGPTFPSNTWIPPLITIDHVLTRHAAATAIRTLPIPGSDHRALLSTIHIPLDPNAS